MENSERENDRAHFETLRVAASYLKKRGSRRPRLDYFPQ